MQSFTVCIVRESHSECNLLQYALSGSRTQNAIFLQCALSGSHTQNAIFFSVHCEGVTLRMQSFTVCIVRESQNAIFYSVHCQGVTLRMKSFTVCIVRESHSECNLLQCALSGSHTQNAIFYSMLCQGVALRMQSFYSVHCQGVTLRMKSFTVCIVRESHSECNLLPYALSGSHTQNAIFYSMLCQGVALRMQSFYSVHCQGVTLRMQSFTVCIVRESHSECNLLQCALSGSLRMQSFTVCIVRELHSECNLLQCALSGSHTQNAIFYSVNCQGVTLKMQSFYSVHCQGVTLRMQSFTVCIVRESHSECNLLQCALSGSHTQNAIFYSEHCQGVTLRMQSFTVCIVKESHFSKEIFRLWKEPGFNSGCWSGGGGGHTLVSTHPYPDKTLTTILYRTSCDGDGMNSILGSPIRVLL